MSIISVMYWYVSLRYVNFERLVVECMCKCTSVPVQRKITVEEWKMEPAVEINREVEESLETSNKKNKLLEFMNEVKVLVF